MVGSRQHYERAFEAALRQRRLPYVLVDDAKRAILPGGSARGPVDGSGRPRRLKSFDAVVYGPQRHALVEVKGRRIELRPGGSGRWESWTTVEDVRSLVAWERLFGEPYDAVLVFVYWLEGPAGLAPASDLIRFEGRLYTHRAVRVSDYVPEMKMRSPKWGTVNLPSRVFERLGGSIDDLLAGFAPDLAGAARIKPITAAPSPAPALGVGSGGAISLERAPPNA